MLIRIRCQKCGVLVEYNTKSVHEGNRDFEEVFCPNCNNHLDRIFTDLIPSPRIVKEDN